MFYQIVAVINKHTAKGVVVSQVPTFYLHSAIQGIVDAKHAEKVAVDVVNPTKDPAVVVHTSIISVMD